MKDKLEDIALIILGLGMDLNNRIESSPSFLQIQTSSSLSLDLNNRIERISVDARGNVILPVLMDLNNRIESSRWKRYRDFEKWLVLQDLNNRIEREKTPVL